MRLSALFFHVVAVLIVVKWAQANESFRIHAPKTTFGVLYQKKQNCFSQKLSSHPVVAPQDVETIKQLRSVIARAGSLGQYTSCLNPFEGLSDFNFEAMSFPNLSMDSLQWPTMKELMENFELHTSGLSEELKKEIFCETTRLMPGAILSLASGGVSFPIFWGRFKSLLNLVLKKKKVASPVFKTESTIVIKAPPYQLENASSVSKTLSPLSGQASLEKKISTLKDEKDNLEKMRKSFSTMRSDFIKDFKKTHKSISEDSEMYEIFLDEERLIAANIKERLNELVIREHQLSKITHKKPEVAPFQELKRINRRIKRLEKAKTESQKLEVDNLFKRFDDDDDDF